ncbi:MAG TPA: FG-GAP-like repeat-containing protein, partial [Pyrinomonadaceae bacterium]|nr:FG-GAP-like repeat-containing protein [Pyrinomonadaceae bacterium]
FWDGRAAPVFTDPISGAVVLQNGAALESQVLGPPISSEEMAHGGRNWTEVATQIAAAKPLALSPNIPSALQTWIDGRGYPELFQEAFGTSDVTPSRIAMAIATFERSLFTDRTPFDAAVSGITQLTAQEQRGQGVFNQAQCNGCHTGALFSDNQFHYIGLRPAAEDTGRFQVTGNSNNLGQFRTPSLRNVELRGPFMHNGRFATLEEVVDFYNRGGDFDAPNKDPRVRPRNLSAQQRADLVAFLKRPLTDSRAAAQTSPFDRPTLYSESSRVPQIIGSGIAGTGGLVPEVTAIEPPLLGNPKFTVAVSSALGNAQAVLVIDDNEPIAGPNIPSTASFARLSLQLYGNGYGSTSLAIPNNAALVGRTFYGRWYITDPAAPGGVAASRAFKFTVFGGATSTTQARHADFDGDGKTDVSVFRPSEGIWYVLQSSNNNLKATNFGLASDRLVPADYDGDGKTDVAVYRNGTWYLMRSLSGFTAIQFGLPEDRPQPADYDGDSIADVAVFRPSNGTWYIQRSRDGFTAINFGLSSDRPVAADYDGDGKTDVAVYRNGTWYIQRSRDGFTAVNFGLAEDKPVLGDYDGDGKSDVAVFRPGAGSWYYLRSTDNGFRARQFGIGTDIPSPGDYDGDGMSDFAVFRAGEGNWYVSFNASGVFRSQTWGTNGDVPAPSAIVP